MAKYNGSGYGGLMAAATAGSLALVAATITHMVWAL